MPHLHVQAAILNAIAAEAPDDWLSDPRDWWDLEGRGARALLDDWVGRAQAGDRRDHPDFTGHIQRLVRVCVAGCAALKEVGLPGAYVLTDEGKNFVDLLLPGEEPVPLRASVCVNVILAHFTQAAHRVVPTSA